MKKSDLKPNMVVKLRDRSLMMVVNEMLVEKDCNLPLSKFNNSLICNGYNMYDIMAIYEISDKEFIFDDLRDRNYNCLTLIWQRVDKITLEPFEKEILKKLTDFQYITRDNNNDLEIYITKPSENINHEYWISSNPHETLSVFNHMFQTIKPMTCYKISDLIED